MPDLSFEKKNGFPLRKIAGVDEVGRGCLAGPVVAAAAILPSFESFERPKKTISLARKSD